ncbi:hypothetical protein JTB14_006490, partial [Gonioctena quinquepunctata]
LKVAQNFDDFETSVKSVEQECINSDWIVSDSENILTMREDLEKILKGPKKSDSKFYIICALSDFVHLLEKAILPNEEGSSKGFITISLALKVAQNFDDFETSVKSVEQECINSDWIVSDSENILTMREDLEKILKGPKKSDSKFYIICALSDFVHLVNNFPMIIFLQ